LAVTLRHNRTLTPAPLPEGEGFNNWIEDNTMSQGKIIQIIGAVVDVEFPRDAVPKV
jgi:hypothetical protein